jgi:uncharacterized iron-regulated membrane protein
MVALVAGISTFALGVGAGVSSDHVEFLIMISGAVVAVVGAVAWIDRRIEVKIQAHNKLDQARHAQQRYALRLIAAKLGVELPAFEDDEG